MKFLQSQTCIQNGNRSPTMFVHLDSTRRSKWKNINFTNACQLQRVNFFTPDSKEKLIITVKILHDPACTNISYSDEQEQEGPGIHPPTCTLNVLGLPLSFACLCIIWTSNESSRNVCSRIKERNFAWMVEMRFSSVYNAMVCSHSFQFANHSTNVLTWSRKSVWCAGFMSLAKDNPWNRREMWLIFENKHANTCKRSKVSHTHLHESKLGERENLTSPIFLSIHVQPPNTCVGLFGVRLIFINYTSPSLCSTFEWIARSYNSARICIRLSEAKELLYTIRHQ